MGGRLQCVITAHTRYKLREIKFNIVNRIIVTNQTLFHMGCCLDIPKSDPIPPVELLRVESAASQLYIPSYQVGPTNFVILGRPKGWF